MTSFSSTMVLDKYEDDSRKFRQEKKIYQAMVRFEKISNASYKISYLNWLFSYGLFMTYLLDSTHTTKKKEVGPWSN